MTQWMLPSIEKVTKQPTKAALDYYKRFNQPCILTYSDNTITSIFQGTGIAPLQHPLEREFMMLGVPMSQCGHCLSREIEVIYARFDRPLEDARPGEIICAYEVFCEHCNYFTYREYIL
ncbi:MAG: hypothetical protein EAZ76_03990 [Nostocales cyanobacterium]|nr:MAG: hypothetical protein EAZ87_18935 [Nostocales cyanobacterium]TAF19034.1 MAG: hypothetical protein EAZ76_03990 [Nostocales cyanobacterium]